LAKGEAAWPALVGLQETQLCSSRRLLCARQCVLHPAHVEANTSPGFLSVPYRPKQLAAAGPKRKERRSKQLGVPPALEEARPGQGAPREEVGLVPDPVAKQHSSGRADVWHDAGVCLADFSTAPMPVEGLLQQALNLKQTVYCVRWAPCDRSCFGRVLQQSTPTSCLLGNAPSLGLRVMHEMSSALQSCCTCLLAMPRRCTVCCAGGKSRPPAFTNSWACMQTTCRL